MKLRLCYKPTRPTLSTFMAKLLLLTAFLPMVVLNNPALASTGLSMTTGFDNNLIHATRPDSRYLEILVTTPDLDSFHRQQQRLPLNVALVLDRSGSMAHQDKLRHVKKAALAILDKLRPGDRFSLITYDDYATVLIASQPVEGLSHARSLINSIHPGGSTNMQAGLEEGYRQLRRYSSPRSTNRVLLFSDGQANVGITSPQRLGNIALDEAGNSISLSTFGVGCDFNENLMAALAENGLGMYYFIDSSGSIAEILAREFRAVEQVVATDIRIEVQFADDINIAQVMANRYEIKKNRVIMYGGDLSAGERRRFQIRIHPPAHKSGNFEAGGVKMSYRPAGQDYLECRQEPMQLRYLTDARTIENGRNDAISERSSIFEAHHARSQAADAVDRGDLRKAQAILAQAQQDMDHKAKNSKRLQKELSEIDSYAAALRKPLNNMERGRIQKSVKYDSYVLEGC
ncbi:MAG: VWA domain-containing protein [Proteobacteria bacterium]|nr:VWA domain-containing protein [Pseudomonadota bacterium]MBU1639376.1 VWA domain-containing protein [Pseudomonadota bacterium]